MACFRHLECLNVPLGRHNVKYWEKSLGELAPPHKQGILRIAAYKAYVLFEPRFP